MNKSFERVLSIPSHLIRSINLWGEGVVGYLSVPQDYWLSSSVYQKMTSSLFSVSERLITGQLIVTKTVAIILETLQFFGTYWNIEMFDLFWPWSEKQTGDDLQVILQFQKWPGLKIILIFLQNEIRLICIISWMVFN